MLIQRIILREVVEDCDIFAGAIPGKNALADVLKRITVPESAQALFLDFGGISAATASYLRELVLGLRNYCLRLTTPLVLVVANPSAAVLEELDFLLSAMREAILICSLDRELNYSEVSVIGSLDETKRQTLEAIERFKEVDAGTLSTNFLTFGKVQPTAWNNRLASLAAMGLAIEIRKGKSKFYRPVMEVH